MVCDSAGGRGGGGGSTVVALGEGAGDDVIEGTRGLALPASCWLCCENGRDDVDDGDGTTGIDDRVRVLAGMTVGTTCKLDVALISPPPPPPPPTVVTEGCSDKLEPLPWTTRLLWGVSMRGGELGSCVDGHDTKSDPPPPPPPLDCWPPPKSPFVLLSSRRWSEDVENIALLTADSLLL